MKASIFAFVSFIIILGIIVFFGSNYLNSSSYSASLSFFSFLPLVLVAALIDSVNPCAFSILIISIGFLFSLRKTRGEILRIGLAYILGIFVVYILIGLGILQALQLFNTPRFMAKIGAALLILWGVIDLLSSLIPNFPVSLKIPKVAHSRIALLMEKASLSASFVLGLFVGLCEFPCTGGPYLVILGLLHDKTTFVSGLSHLLIYNFVFVLPLLIILLFISNGVVLAKMEEFKRNNVRGFGIVASLAMIALGVLLLIFY